MLIYLPKVLMNFVLFFFSCRNGQSACMHLRYHNKIFLTCGIVSCSWECKTRCQAVVLMYPSWACPISVGWVFGFITCFTLPTVACSFSNGVCEFTQKKRKKRKKVSIMISTCCPQLCTFLVIIVSFFLVTKTTLFG